MNINVNIKCSTSLQHNIKIGHYSHQGDYLEPVSYCMRCPTETALARNSAAAHHSPRDTMGAGGSSLPCGLHV